MAAAAGLKVALEFMRFRSVRTILAAADLVRRAARPNVGVLVDALHLDRSAGTAAEVAALSPGMIALAQLCDAPAVSPAEASLPAEARTSRLHPGQGGLQLGALLDALPAELPLSIEVPNASYAGLTAADRARTAGAAARRFLADYAAGGLGRVVKSAMMP
jgi:sugar phosphate isomerase/epimerase